MAAEVLHTYAAHDVCHDLESAVWLLLCMVLRHTLQVTASQSHRYEYERYYLYLRCFDADTEWGSFIKKNSFMYDRIRWEVKGNKPLTKLIRDLRDLVYKQNWDPTEKQRIPMTYKSVLSTINSALASTDWPIDDAALPFMAPLEGDSSIARVYKRDREDSDSPDSDARDAVGRSPLQSPAKKLRA